MKHHSHGLAPIIGILCALLMCVLVGFYALRSSTMVPSQELSTQIEQNSALKLDTSEPVTPDIVGKPERNDLEDRPAKIQLFSTSDLKSLDKEKNSDADKADVADDESFVHSQARTEYETVGEEEAFQPSALSGSSDHSEPLFTAGELRELARSARRGRGLSAAGGPPVPTNSTTVDQPEPEETTEDDSEGEEEEEEPERSLLGGQERGYTLLSLMHPRARESSERHVELLFKSRVARVLLGVLVDGTFGYDQSYFESVVRRLGGGDQRLTLVVYLSNGPTMRNYDNTPITAGFARVSPDDFRDRIRFDPSTRERYAEIARRVRPILVLNRSIHPANRNVVIPMLEDNLRSDSYQAARTLARSILGDLATFVRNPCPGCWDGNDTESGGDPLELHSVSSLELLNNNDFFSLDGIGFHFSNEPPSDSTELDPTAVVNLIDFSRARGLRGFALWRRDRQGLSSGASVHPDSRVYVPPDPRFEAEELALLRHNLIEVVPDEAGTSTNSEES